MAILTRGSNYLQQDYFKSEEYGYRIDQFVSLLYVFELNDLTAEEMKKEIVVSSEEIEEHRTRYGNLGDQISSIGLQYDQQIQDAIDSGNNAVKEALINERDKKIADITENFNSDEHVRAKIIKEKERKVDEFFQDLQQYRRDYAIHDKAFKFYLKDEDGKIFTNLDMDGKSPADFFNQKEMYHIHDYSDLQQQSVSGNFEGYMLYNEVAEQILNKQNKEFTGEIGVAKSTPLKNPLMQEYKEYQKMRILLIAYTIASVAALLAGYVMARRKPVIAFAGLEKWQSRYDRIPIDIRAAILLASGLVLALALTLLSEQFIYFNQSIINTVVELGSALFVSAVMLSLIMIQVKFFADYRNDWLKLQTDWRKSITYKLYDAAKLAFLNTSIGTQLVLLLGIVFFLGGLAAGVLIEPMFILVFGTAFLLLGMPVLYLIFKKAGYFNQIVDNAQELAAGKMGTDLKVKGRSILARHAADVNTLRHAVKTSYREQAKSERLKTELITNVSHDLRTPLTSIITYTELLKTPDLAVEDRNAYVEIIDRKSKRLKVLIDDLFEASKMASGSIELNKEKVDLNQLLQQALAEYNEALAESSLQLRVSQPEQPVYAFVDGQKIWRVFDNLIGNILKYSLEQTRVYISVKSEQDKALLVFKNVTKYELGEDLEELFERFKRGDQSRHTEGSGLGLAIAKSIVDLHDGSLDIEIDGDLFKVTVKLEKME